MKNSLSYLIFVLLFIGIGAMVLLWFTDIPVASETVSVRSERKEVGQPVDSLNGVYVYYNGSVGNVSGRNTAADGYNLGLKYQCVEFVKRYYYEHYRHKMPDSWGHAKDFFEAGLSDGAFNSRRHLTQYTNPSRSKPQVGDLLVYGGSHYNSYGHVSIVSKVFANALEIIQQNPGPTASSRARFDLHKEQGLWKIKHSQIVGWLRKE